MGVRTGLVLFRNALWPCTYYFVIDGNIGGIGELAVKVIAHLVLKEVIHEISDLGITKGFPEFGGNLQAK